MYEWILGKIAEVLATGQAEDLLQISQNQLNMKNPEIFSRTINNEMVQNLKQIYDLYVEWKMPFIEQVRLLSLLARTWSYEKTMEIFSCSRHAIKVAHRMYDDQEYFSKRDEEPAIRQRADPEKIKHFVNWLVESNTLVSGSNYSANNHSRKTESY